MRYLNYIILLLAPIILLGQTTKKKPIKRPERQTIYSFLKSMNDSTPKDIGIELTIKFNPISEKNKSGYESMSILATNHNKISQKLYKPLDGSYWCLTKPCIYFHIEEFIDNKWKIIDYDTRLRRCTVHGSWEHNPKPIEIKPNETVEIDSFIFRRQGIGEMYFIRGHKKLRFTAEYIIDGNKFGENEELIKYGYTPIHLKSKPLVIDYINHKHPVDYPSYIDNLKKTNEFTKSKIKQRARVIKFPGSNKERLNVALKKWGLNPNKNKIKADYMFETTDKEGKFPFQGFVIENKGKYYLIIFARLTRYGVEKSYKSDYCKLYKIN